MWRKLLKYNSPSADTNRDVYRQQLQHHRRAVCDPDLDIDERYFDHDHAFGGAESTAAIGVGHGLADGEHELCCRGNRCGRKHTKIRHGHRDHSAAWAAHGELHREPDLRDSGFAGDLYLGYDKRSNLQRDARHPGRRR